MSILITKKALHHLNLEGKKKMYSWISWASLSKLSLFLKFSTVKFNKRMLLFTNFVIWGINWYSIMTLLQLIKNEFFCQKSYNYNILDPYMCFWLPKKGIFCLMCYFRLRENKSYYMMKFPWFHKQSNSRVSWLCGVVMDFKTDERWVFA